MTHLGIINLLYNIVKFLIIQTAFIGDVILATPVIEKIHDFFPDSKIDFLLKDGTQNILRNNPIVNNIIVWKKDNNKNRNLIKIIKLIRSVKYDYVINLQRYFSTGLICLLSNANQTIGFDKNPLSFLYSIKIKHKIKRGTHEIERNLSLITNLTDNKLIKPKVYPSEEDFKLVADLTKKPYICIAPISLSYTKKLPANKWIKIINKINSRIYLIGAKDDFNECENIKIKCKNNDVINLCGKLSLLQSAALIKEAMMNFVTDSAPLHLASAMNAPTTSIFCSTTPTFGFGPLSEDAKIVEIQEELDCRPCGLHGLVKCPEKHFKCANNILIEDIVT